MKISRFGRFERAGARVLNALVLVAIISALVLVGRMALWSELIAAIRGETDISRKTETDSKAKRESVPRSDKGRPDGKAPKAANDKAPKAANDKAPKAADDKTQKAAKVAEVSREEKNLPVESLPAAPQKAEKLPSAQDQPQSQIAVEQLGAKNSDEAGLVINSHTPAKIYINGQFSGITPRTIKLNAGDHQIRLMADGYEEWTRRVRVKNKQQVEINATIKKKGSQKE
ncbi:MAG TPA: PEGA domain-containing protein [Blastocatellia bacterium]|nr:PEGA domain-containing protein [Blastocatellia bacterium]